MLTHKSQVLAAESRGHNAALRIASISREPIRRFRYLHVLMISTIRPLLMGMSSTLSARV